MHPDPNQPLALSDIMHTMSPSPGPSPEADTRTEPSEGFIHSEQRPSHDLETDEEELEVLSSEDLQRMQTRLEEVGLSASQAAPSSSSCTPLEAELGDMVSRLLHQYKRISAGQFTEQIVSQAETIASLTVQRDRLIQQYADACVKWEAERQGWERSSEALIRQRTAAASATKEEIVDRLIARLEDENRRLRNKVLELRNRLVDVEAELYKLRPLLLVPPVTPDAVTRSKSGLKATSQRYPAEDAASEAVAKLVDSADKRRTEEPTPTSDANVVDPSSVSASQTTEPDNSVASSSQTLSTQPTLSADLMSSEDLELAPPRFRSYYRTPREREIELATPRRMRGAAVPATSTPAKAGPTSTTQVLSSSWAPQTRADQRTAASLLSDARAELIMHAARKIGKRRAGSLAGLVVPPDEPPEQSAQDESVVKGKGKERAGSKSSEKGKDRDPGEPDGGVPVKKQRKRAVKKASTMPQASSGPSSSTAGTGYYGSLPGMSHLVYVNPVHPNQRMGPIPGGAPGAVPVFVPMGGVWPPLMASGPAPAPASPGKARDDALRDAGTPTRAARPAPTTPGLRRSESAGTTQGLDSLLSAARMLGDDAGTDAARTPSRSSRRAAGGADALEATPTPKRRRVAPGTPSSTSRASAGETTPVHTPTPKPLGRISSALDVLADQAAQEQERRPATPLAAEEAGRRGTAGQSRGTEGRSGKEKAEEPSASSTSRGSPARHVSTEPNSSREGTPAPLPVPSVPQPSSLPTPHRLPAEPRRTATPLSDTDAPGSPENSMDVGE